MNIIEKISELNLNGYYDNSSGYVTVWFHNNLIDKPDIVAYLKQDMSWDIREVISEQSQIQSDRETITIFHNPVGNEIHGSEFDQIIRKMINALVENSKDLTEPIRHMKKILDCNSYNLNVLN